MASSLWLGLCFPHLPLEIHTRGAPAAAALVISDSQAARPRVLACNAAALAQGITPGMPLGAAYALVAALELRPRSPAAEHEALQRLAAWAIQYTPTVSLQPPQGLLLEIGGSLRLYGDLDHILGSIKDGIENMGFSPTMAVAPTPLGSWLLARSGQEERITDHAGLGLRLSRLPIAALETAPATLEALQGMGLRRIGECLRLPRSGLARRFGRDFLSYLDRALGRMPDPRRMFVPPPRYLGQLTLPAEVQDHEALLFSAHRLILELGGMLRARDAGVQRMVLGLWHHRHPVTRVALGLARPSRDPQHLLALLRERLAPLALPAPVLEVTLEAGDILPLGKANSSIFDNAHEVAEAWPELVEKLRARMGREAVQGLGAIAEHRPERAWCCREPREISAAEPPLAPRPLWLLDPPLPLSQDGQHPCWEDAPLTLQAGPERIETGWWDAAGVTRDYFVAATRQGARLWIFRERQGRLGWFVQGVFA